MNNTSTIPAEVILNFEKIQHFHYLVVALALMAASVYGAYVVHKNFKMPKTADDTVLFAVLGVKAFLVLAALFWFLPVVLINYFTLLELYVAPEIFLETYEVKNLQEREKEFLREMGCIKTQFKTICKGDDLQW